MKITLRLAVVFLVLSLLVIRPTSSYAYWHDGWHGHGYVGVNIGVWPGPYYGYGYPYYGAPYYGDPYYYPDAVLVASSNYQPVVVNGVTYYVNNGVYYVYTQNGYQAVATPAGATSTPVVQTAPVEVTASGTEAISDDAITINIPNSVGGYTPVLLKRKGSGFEGPQGEYYSEFPKVSQLKLMYGK